MRRAIFQLAPTIQAASPISASVTAPSTAAAYTYLNPTTGHEFSGVGGFTYNFRNPDTGVQSGVDFHFDWGASQFLSKQLFVGLVGYAYQQISDDAGGAPILGGFRSRLLGVGPQIGYIFPIGGMQGYLNLKGYGEFDAANRPSGLEYLADVLNLAGACEHGHADQALGNETAIAAARSGPSI